MYPNLPDSEHTIMQIIWAQPTPISKTRVAELAAPQRGWAPQTVYTLLNRLVEKGFLSSEKQGKERYYVPLVQQEAYLAQATERFMDTMHKNSLTGLMNALFTGKPDDADLAELEQWLRDNANKGG